MTTTQSGDPSVPASSLNPIFATRMETNDNKHGGRRISICIVAHNGYGAISGGDHGHIGGVERQTSLLARWLVGRGHDVSYLTWHEGGPVDEVINGVRVIKICPRSSGIAGLRFAHPRWSGLVRALRAANAGIYYQNCGGCVTGQVAMWCDRHFRPFVFSVASDADCVPSLPELPAWRERVLYKYGLRHATTRIVQTEAQRRNLLESFGVDSVLIPIVAPDPGPREDEPQSGLAPRIAWVGRFCRVKRPDMVLDIAEKCPEFRFDIAGPVYEDAYARSAERRARQLPNVRLLGPVPRKQMDKIYREAILLCCTSAYEGFPNTFLEAWSHGLPVVSTFDPDGLISRLGLGRVGTDVTSLIEGIRGLLGDRANYGSASQYARDYFLKNHSIQSIMPRFEEIFTGLAKEAGIH